MSRDRFDNLFTNLRCSQSPAVRPEGMSSEQHRWRLIDDFVEFFNEHRAQFFSPSTYICSDESLSRWYGQGGDWINMGLPMYVAIDRKPDNGCEIQNSACGVSGIMLRLKLVKTAEEEGAHLEEAGEGLNHGTKVLKYLVTPWAHTDRIVCADSYFASVSTAEELQKIGLRFIGVVKTATKKFPMKFLTEWPFSERGNQKGLLHYDANGVVDMMAYGWVDRDRRYFITTAGSLGLGNPYLRYRWRQVDLEPNANPERVELTVPQPVVCEHYYNTCGKIDGHNRHRQATLQMERKLKTQDWAVRVNMSILCMIIVDSWLMWKGLLWIGEGQKGDFEEAQKLFYTYLSEELIDNTYNGVGSARRREFGEGGSPGLATSAMTGAPRSGVSAHLTPTKKRRLTLAGKLTNHLKQGRCRMCSKKSQYTCSLCLDMHDDTKEVFLCHSKTGRACFAEHIENVHQQCQHSLNVED